VLSIVEEEVVVVTGKTETQIAVMPRLSDKSWVMTKWKELSMNW